jgi:Restriction endonuclease
VVAHMRANTHDAHAICFMPRDLFGPREPVFWTRGCRGSSASKIRSPRFIGGPPLDLSLLTQVAMTSNDKGRALERALHTLERAILRHSPGLSEHTFKLESRKQLTVRGVRQEIDLYVSFDITPVYSAVFVFECKNWVKPVGKNEIIIFSRKIEAANAQQGFFVAKSFTRDAKAQAATDPRMELLVASEPEVLDIQSTLGEYHHLVLNPITNLDIEFFRKPGERVGTRGTIDLSTALLSIDGKPELLAKWIDGMAQNAFREAVLKQDTGALATGRYPSTFQATVTLEDKIVTIDGHRFLSICMEGRGSFDVLQPTVLSSFDIEKRGRSVRLQSSFADFTVDEDIATNQIEERRIKHVWSRR